MTTGHGDSCEGEQGTMVSLGVKKIPWGKCYASKIIFKKDIIIIEPSSI